MNYVGVRELKNDASEVIRAVREEHARYIVTFHGRPVAIIVPVDPLYQGSVGASIFDFPRDNTDFWSEQAALRAEVDAKWHSDQTAVDLVAEQRR